MTDKQKIEQWLIGLRFTEVCEPPIVSGEEEMQILKDFRAEFQKVYKMTLDKVDSL